MDSGHIRSSISNINKAMHHLQIKALIKENQSLFWYTPEKDKENINLDSVVEAILNYGNEKSVKKLFAIIDIQQVADIFYRQISKKRSNYFPQVENFFNLYFQKHVHKDSYKRST